MQVNQPLWASFPFKKLILQIFAAAMSLQSSPTLCDPMDCSSPGFSVHGILQTRVLEWVAIPPSRESSWPRDWTPISYVSCIGRVGSLPLVPPGKPLQIFIKGKKEWWCLSSLHTDNLVAPSPPLDPSEDPTPGICRFLYTPLVT